MEATRDRVKWKADKAIDYREFVKKYAPKVIKEYKEDGKFITVYESR